MKLKEIDNAYSGKRHKSVLELVFPGQNLEKFKMDRREDYIPYERYKTEREQKMFDESFYVVDMEDATEEENEDIRMVITLIFNNFLSDADTTGFGGLKRRSTNVRERVFEELNEEKDSTDTTSTDSGSSNKLLDANHILNPKRADKLFVKACLRDMFMKECLKKIPEKRQPVLLAGDSYASLNIALKAIVNSMLKTNESDSAKFIDMIRILNTFYSKTGEEKHYLFNQFHESPIFKDISM